MTHGHSSTLVHISQVEVRRTTREERRRLREGRLDNYFIGDRRIFARCDLTVVERAVYLCLSSHARREDSTAWPSYSTIARECGISRLTAIRAVVALEHKGLVKKETTGKLSNVYTVFRA